MTTEAPPGERLERTARAARRAAPRALAAERGLNDAGYLDLLEGELESTGPTQDLMVTRLVPAIYERYWRPALGRVAKGVTGPGMAEEIRIARLLLGLGEGDTVLDVACGPGQLHPRVRARRRARRARGRDRRLADDARARRRGAAPRPSLRNLALIRGDATALPFARRELRRGLLLRRPAPVPGPVRRRSTRCAAC